MKTTKHRLFPFEACSVLLFSACLIGAPLAAHAQPASGAAAPSSVGAAAPSKFTIGPAASVSAAAQAAFDKADANHDGKLSPKEAAAHLPKGQRFQQLDTNHDGFLSSEEFDQGGAH